MIPAPVMVSNTGRKIAVREHLWSTIVRMALCFPICGNPVIRSIATCLKGLVLEGTGILYSGALT